MRRGANRALPKEWRRFMSGMSDAGLVRPFILESWERSRAAGVIAETNSIRLRRVGPEELERRLAAADELLQTAKPHLDWLSLYLSGVTHTCYITDADGIVLYSCGDAEMRERFGLTPGHDWSEAIMGTNGAGTALASGAPVAIEGAEHFCLAFHDATCTGAPIYMDGALVGALDVSTSVADATPDRLAVVAHMAFVIGRELSLREKARRQAQKLAAYERAEEQLKESDRRKNEYLATLAHELRNPLAPLRHSMRIIRSTGASDEQRGWAYEVIDRQIGHMARLLDDLLEASRISRGQIELRREPTDLIAVISTAVDTVRSLVEAKRHVLMVQVPERPVWLDADPVRLTQVFTNLLTNATKYTDPRGKITLDARIDGRAVTVSVRDTGIGIAPEVLPRVFHMFSQARSTLDHAEGGLGIGLAVARGLVGLHGGSIEARSEGPGRGSEFIVKLPLPGDQDYPDPKRAGEPQSASAAAHRILVADDNRDSAESLAMVMRLEGHEVEVAHDGRQALTIAAIFRPDLLLLDIGMPELNGYEVARQIRAEPWGRAMILVAVTGWGQEEDKRRALEAGFDHHLTKPIDLDQLARLLTN